LKLYLDGVLDSQGTWTGAFEPTTIGQSLAGNGQIGIDEFLLYDRALSASEIAGLT